MQKPTFVYKTYINTTPEQLWQGLTEPAFTQRFGGQLLNRIGRWGSTITWDDHGVTIADPAQVVLEFEPYRRLA
jgi:uncharacterized protein YndB with AHSA1/START domain